MATFAKPENALKRAEELINVGQKQEALQALHDLITSRRYRAWQKTHERIMFKYVELCVDMRRGGGEVIKHFMHLATERAELARNQAQALEEALDVEDLEADKKPEDLMLSYVSVEKGKDRSDHELMTAHRAFQFCKQYKRTTEFRRLCEIIRNHLANLNKWRDQRDRPDLSAPESLQLYLDTRIEQLGLWQEAFRSIEDIYGLMCMVKKILKPSLMVVYYGKLTEIFRMSSNYLYHAYAWLKLFSLQKSFNKNLSQKDLQLIASSVVLAALSLENEKEKSLRVANLIGFDVEPRAEKREAVSQSSILSELVSKGVMACVNQEVKDLYHLLEHEFLSLDLALKVQPLLNKISKFGGKLSSASSVPEVQLSQYVPALEKPATLRFLQQVSQVYQTIQISNLSKMIPFFDFAAIEKISVDAVRHNFVAIKVDHINGAVFFGKQKVAKLGDALSNLAEIVEKEHKRLLARKSIIETRKEEQKCLLLEKERVEESKRREHQKMTEEAEQKRVAAELEQRRNQRILKEIEDRELEEAQAMLQEAENHSKRKKKPVLDGVGRQEKENKLQKFAKIMDYLERAKREEAAPLIQTAFQWRLAEEVTLHERDQQQQIELSQQRHAGDLVEKRRLGRMLENKIIFQERVVSRREAEFNSLKQERQERINQIIQTRKQDRDTRRKLIYFLRTQEEQQKRLQEEEAARKREEAEKRKREEAERKAKLDAIAEKQRQRELELEEKKRLEREEVLGKSMPVSSRPAEPPAVDRSSEAGATAPAATAAAPTPGKFVPRFKREKIDVAGQAPPPETDRWGSGSRPDNRPSDRWGCDERKPPSFGGGSRTSWASSRC
ncbi:hypothetical protein K7X08_007274 [Anisodus acutangulus]|uniref:PCI domain-containing protein n=1 Tax=Anisodus acutangulus TaxID=402998 RepID=A0A9Q1LFU3_9SOLA|nr:hypothetical protein K7X08_007274 [Anisodus acutangulus]